MPTDAEVVAAMRTLRASLARQLQEVEAKARRFREALEAVDKLLALMDTSRPPVPVVGDEEGEHACHHD